MDKTRKDPEFDLIYEATSGRHAPLYWVAIMILAFPLCMIFQIVNDIGQKHQCQNWVGENAVYDSGLCYRYEDGSLIYVDVDLEKKILALEKSGHEE